MDTHRIVQWIVAILLIVAVFFLDAFADPTPVIYSYDIDMPLLDANGYVPAKTEAEMEVPDHFVITDLNIQIDITHEFVFDLQLVLEGPNGDSLCLNKYEGGEIFVGEDYTNTIFDDEAAVSIEDGTAPFTGSFKPEPGELLEIFDGSDAYGTWRLQIFDMYATDTGTLDQVKLIFNVPEPATAAILMFAACFAALTRPRRKI
jgi:subtilisin-like proprotein convertase family protein